MKKLNHIYSILFIAPALQVQDNCKTPKSHPVLKKKNATNKKNVNALPIGIALPITSKKSPTNHNKTIRG